ncbi:uncharacterized protein BDV14DRAFT_8737 [Aspergillus stella-maris]|uniref:uncharacterized protein n=1 Tax=Aspergillus stella-maris TaxID=1810926 RepID=UPI003CCCEFF7
MFDFFTQRQGLYFWSLLVATVSTGGLMLFTTVFMFKDVSIAVILIMVSLFPVSLNTAHALVLYSRLHLVINGRIVSVVF